jgi:hypothetical protein
MADNKSRIFLVGIAELFLSGVQTQTNSAGPAPVGLAPQLISCTAYVCGPAVPWASGTRQENSLREELRRPWFGGLFRARSAGSIWSEALRCSAPLMALLVFAFLSANISANVRAPIPSWSDT